MKDSCRSLANRFGDLKHFLIAFNPDKQFELTHNKDKCYFGDYPTLAKLNQEYCYNASILWLNVQIYNISEFCGCKDKISQDQILECSRVITATFPFLKVSEIMLFFFQFKAGKYGRFYGSVDPLVITTSLRDFLRERNNAYFERECEQNRIDANNMSKNAISYDEWQKMKKEMEQKK